MMMISRMERSEERERKEGKDKGKNKTNNKKKKSQRNKQGEIVYKSTVSLTGIRKTERE
jgi:hypothetical protein